MLSVRACHLGTHKEPLSNLSKSLGDGKTLGLGACETDLRDLLTPLLVEVEVRAQCHDSRVVHASLGNDMAYHS